MELSTSMRFVMVRAEAEAFALRTRVLREEHLFLGILKLAELSAQQISPTSSHKEEIDEDIHLIKAKFQTLELKSGEVRNTLRQVLHTSKQAQENEVSSEPAQQLLEKAQEYTQQEGRSRIGGFDVLRALLKDPTPSIRQVLWWVFEQEAHTEPSVEEPAQPSLPGKEFLPELTEQIGRMRATLLSKVHGQDHAIHSFAEGMFSAEVLAQADEKRKRPRATFVFAGPPGVGKTFLAEQAAEALAIPFKRFDMSSCADHQAHLNLIGFAPSYKDAKAGTLTDFVQNNPHSILLFDEVEKAHLNTIHLFLQILDAGILHDDFEDKDVPFKDTIIIFTTNAGRQLYEGDEAQDAAGIPRHTILNALETDTHPQTGRPFFPAAICSRLATGWPLMFNHLQAQHLVKISQSELARCAALFEKQYEISTKADPFLAATLLFSEGGQVDARTLRAQTELFFKNELYKLSRLYEQQSFSEALEEIEQIEFVVEQEGLPNEIARLYQNPNPPKVLIYSDIITAETAKDMLLGFEVTSAQTSEEAFFLAGEQEFDFLLLDLCNNQDELDAAVDPDETWLSIDTPPNVGNTMVAFDFVPMTAGALKSSRQFFVALHERLPELPVYLLETSKINIDSELLCAFIRAGVRGKLSLPSRGVDPQLFLEETQAIANNLYMQKAAGELAASHQILYFESAPKPGAHKKDVVIRLRDLCLKRSLKADDSGELLEDSQKPNVRFSDVIGATGAKEELKFFVDYLKNPKKFMAQGLRPPKGVLLYGPPGTGKTLLAKAMAGESDVAFLPAVASSFVTKYQGSGPEAVRALFERARRYAPAIIFIDEIDAVGRARGGGNSGHGEEMALNALLTEMDGFSVDPRRPVFVLAATNFEVEEGRGGMGTIDQALSRRFDRKILVDMPNKEDRRRYLDLMLKKRKHNTVSEELKEQLAKRSAGLSLAHLETVIELATRTAVKQNSVLSDELLEEAFELSRHGEKKDWGQDYMKRVARHEAGHAFMCYASGKTPAYLTIVARGGHGGYMEHDSDENSPLKTRQELLYNIRTALGGRASEIAYYGEEEGISTGASGDLEQATRIARAMICSYGMDDEFGLAALSQEEATRGPLSSEVSRRTNHILRREMEHTIAEIKNAKPRIDKLVDALLEKNRLDKWEIEELLN